ncbi:hypothetical protein BDR26DRAFT_796851 [Obelidium mucronatum]|nr:hypothetical protein BDR26DRAFT_796851 [Obelidium mucronatum]
MKPLLAAFYAPGGSQLAPAPLAQIKSKWDSDNKWAFFLAVLEHGRPEHADALNTALLCESPAFHQQQVFSKPPQSRTLLDDLFDFYITPFHSGYSSSDDCDSERASTASSSKPNSTDDIDYLSDNTNAADTDDNAAVVLTHRNFKKTLEKRDRVCLFCWTRSSLKACHIIAQKNHLAIQYDELGLFQRAGLKQKHQIQNGLLLCGNCHDQFGLLKQYVDVVGEQLVLRIINADEKDPEKSREWRAAVGGVQASRQNQKLAFWNESDNNNDDERQVLDNHEMVLYFIKTNPDIQLNKRALEFHKAACLIWKMAGGAQEDEEICPDDNNEDGIIGVSDDIKLTRTREWLHSCSTLIGPE